ncbi:hypothetical protein GOP47_0023812 [Adiantum capillus-veneris]|uniref:Uncharacterized protein n=1 Tax=Adiantum capillus-veneris TaxID=13818 RepID=A0A9D4U4L7_ADICA|nr:hypothetical protein GOP47_0023812 [Adiantum capillus-veneris]
MAFCFLLEDWEGIGPYYSRLLCSFLRASSVITKILDYYFSVVAIINKKFGLLKTDSYQQMVWATIGRILLHVGSQKN